MKTPQELAEEIVESVVFRIFLSILFLSFFVVWAYGLVVLIFDIAKFLQ